MRDREVPWLLLLLGLAFFFYVRTLAAFNLADALRTIVAFGCVFVLMARQVDET